MALNDMVVRQAKASGKSYTLGDTDGLSLNVTAQGGKTWHFRYYWLGKQKRMSLGTYPEVSLRDARSQRDEARALIAKRINPQQAREQQRQVVSRATEHTFNAVYEKWLAHRGLTLRKGRQTSLTLIPRIFAKDVLPALGNRSVYDITRSDLLDIIGRIEQRKALFVAEKVRTWFHQLFRYALVIVPGLERNPASDLDVVALPQPPVRHNPFLRMPELPAMLQALRNYPGRLQTQLGLRLLLLIGQRADVPLLSSLPTQLVTQSQHRAGAFAAPAQRLSAVRMPRSEQASALSQLQRERMLLLDTLEAPHNLPVAEYAKLAGKSRRWISYEIQAGKLLAISLGNRGQRVPDWHLDPTKRQLIQTVLQQAQGADAWQIYHALTQPHDMLDGLAPIEAVTPGNLPVAVHVVCHVMRR